MVKALLPFYSFSHFVAGQKGEKKEKLKMRRTPRGERECSEGENCEVLWQSTIIN